MKKPILTHAEMVDRINSLRKQQYKWEREGIDFFEEGEDLLEKFNEAVNAAYLIYAVLMEELEVAEDTLARVREIVSSPSLTDDQQVVLEWLKWSVEEQGNSPMDAVYLLVLGESLDSVSLAYIALTPDQQTQVLAVLSKEVAE